MGHKHSGLTPSSPHINSAIEVFGMDEKNERTESVERSRTVTEQEETEEPGIEREREKQRLCRGVNLLWLESAFHCPVPSFPLVREPNYYFRGKTVFHRLFCV